VSPLPIVNAPARRIGLPALLLAALAVTGCATVDEYLPTLRSFGVYKLDINQGNYLSQDMVDKLKVGMTKPQVRTVLGTPLLTPIFRDNRWDYLYEYQRQGKVIEHRQFTVYFAEDKVARWEGDEMPQSMVDVNRIAVDKALKHIPSAEDKGFLDKILDIFRGGESK